LHFLAQDCFSRIFFDFSSGQIWKYILSCHFSFSFFNALEDRTSPFSKRSNDRCASASRLSGPSLAPPSLNYCRWFFLSVVSLISSIFIDSTVESVRGLSDVVAVNTVRCSIPFVMRWMMFVTFGSFRLSFAQTHFILPALLVRCTLYFDSCPSHTLTPHTVWEWDMGWVTAFMHVLGGSRHLQQFAAHLRLCLFLMFVVD
jgi:hypothetical protein